MRRASVLMVLAAAALVLAACTDEQGPGLPTAAGTGSASPTAKDSLSQELQFVACMRQQGIADMPDPIPGDNSGRSAVRYALDVLGKGSDDAFQAALDKCVSLLPPPEPEQPAPAEDLQKYLAFARCMRDHGVTDFPDPEPGPDGGPPRVVLLVPDASGRVSLARTMGGGEADGLIKLNLGDPKIKAAVAACGPGLTNATTVGS